MDIYLSFDINLFSYSHQQQVSWKRFLLLANDFIAWLLRSWVIAIRTASCILWCKVISYREMSMQEYNFSAQIMAYR